MKKVIYLLIFFSWLCAALFVRVFELDKSPQSVGFDEASLGYNAYSILKTGKDEYGTRLPLSLRSFNDFKPALYSYLAIPSIYLFGLNDASIRLPSAILGTLSLVFLFLILRSIGKTRHMLIDVLLVALISFFPWRLHFSRVAFEANISMCFFTGVVWCLMNFKRNNFYKLGLFVFSALSIYSYHAARLAVPLLILLYFVDPLSDNFKVNIKNPLVIIKKLLPFWLLLLVYLPLLLESNASLLLTRLSQTNLFSHFYPYTPREIIFMPNVWFNLVGHPFYYLFGIISGHLFSYLSPQNLSLLIYPGVIKSAQAIGGSGMLGFAGGIMFTIGFFKHFREFVKHDDYRVLTYWFVAGIVPAAITWEWFYPLRSINIYPALDAVAALGIIAALDYFSKFRPVLARFTLVLGIIAIFFASSIYNLLNEYGFGSWETAGEFQPGGFKQGAETLLTLKDKYQVIYLDSGHAQSYTLFWYYLKYEPEKVQALATKRNRPGVEGSPVINFDNFVYKKFDWPKDKINNNFAYFTDSEVKEEEISQVAGAKLIKIYGPSGNWAASIITKD